MLRGHPKDLKTILSISGSGDAKFVAYWHSSSWDYIGKLTNNIMLLLGLATGEMGHVGVDQQSSHVKHSTFIGIYTTHLLIQLYQNEGVHTSNWYLLYSLKL